MSYTSNTAEKKLLVVFGATGNQGGSVINTFLSDPALVEQFTLRGITRDVEKESAVALRGRGVEVVKGDIDDKESLRKVMQNAYAVFTVTNWQEVLDKDREIQQGKNVADIAKEVDVKHLIWSSLPNVTKITKGEITGVLHFDSKATVEEYMNSINLPATYLQLGIFMNFVLFQLQPSPTSLPDKKSYILKTPTSLSTKYPLISVQRDVGPYVRSILLSPSTMIGRVIFGGEREYSIQEIVDILRDIGGLDVKAEEIGGDEYRKMLGGMGWPEWLGEDMAANLRYIKEWGYFGGEGVERDHHILTEKLESFEEWVKKSPEVAAMR